MENILQQRSIDYKNFHESVRQGDLEATKAFIEKYPRDKLAFNAEKESAIKIALKSQQFGVYELLIANRFKLGLKENFKKIVDEITENLTGNDPASARRKLRKIHIKHVKSSILLHVHDLIAMSKLSHDTNDAHRRILNEKIMRAFEEVNEFNQIEPVLKLAATAENLEIIFDFQRASVDHMDPTQHDRTFGTTYSVSASILIGAKRLNDEIQRFFVYGTLSHELCHFAMMLTYGNNCKPYHADDEENKLKFTVIVIRCKEVQPSGSIIVEVFDYAPDKWHAEMIVRAVHILAACKNDADSSISYQNSYPFLFDYFNNKCLVDIKQKIAEIETKKEETAMEVCFGPEQFEVMEHTVKKRYRSRNKKTIGIVS